MQGRAFLIIGVALTVSNASGPSEAAASIAKSPLSASTQALSQALPTSTKLIALLPLPEAGHEARRATRILVSRRAWQRVEQPANSSLPAQHAIEKAEPAPDRKNLLAVVDQPDIQERHKIIADEVLRMLPQTCVGRLTNFYVRYDKPERRGLAGKSTIIVDGTLPDEEFRAVLIHEALGHVFDLGCLEGSPGAGTSVFRDGDEPIFRDDASVSFYRISWADSGHQRAGALPEDFVSGYAASDPFEDLAESVIYYVLQHESFTQRAAQNRTLATKLKWLENFLPVQPQRVAEAGAAWNGIVPWDATKLAYIWKNPAIVARQ